MITPDEIDRRVEQHDAPRSARRSTAAKRIAELAGRRAVLAEQLGEIERAIGDELAAAHDVIDVDELAAFTDLPAADLARWLTAHTARTPARAKRKRGDVAADSGHGTSSRRTAPRTPKASSNPAMRESAAHRPDTIDERAPVPAVVT